MSEDRSTSEYYGVLGRVQAHVHHITLRFYPFALLTHGNQNVVLEARFQTPGFDIAEVDRFVGQEVEFLAQSDSAEINDVFAGEGVTLKASSVTTDWCPYDVDDYRNAADKLERYQATLQNDLYDARRKNDRIKSIATELLRRAEIKAATSSEFKRIQTPAIEVLHRILGELE